MGFEEEEQLWRTPGWLYPAILTASAALLFYRFRVLFTRDNKDRDNKPLLSTSCLPPSFLSSQRRFLAVYFLALAAQDLQLVYGESFLASKGSKRHDIALYFVFSHIASMVMGPSLGILTDHIGRKKACVGYCLLQVIGSLAKQFSNDVVYWSASVFDGLSTSLLLSAFESWLVADHEKSGFRQDWASETFWIMSFGAAVVAIGAAGLANFLVGQQMLGIAAPTRAAAMGAGLLAICICLLWEENPLPSHSKLLGTIKSALHICQDRKVLILGCAHACLHFASMVFWFLWTPTLVADGRRLHTGLLFPCLMASQMLGSAFSALLLCGPWSVRPEDSLRWIYLSAGLSLAVPAYDYQEIGVLLAAFCIFNISYGIAWPFLARLRSMYIPTENRAAIMTFFQVPSNAAVVFVLINGSIYQHLENSKIFGISIMGLLIGGYCLHLLNQWRQQPHEKFSTERP